MANKLHWPINAGASGCCGADTGGVYSGTGSILVMKTGSYMGAALNQNADVISLFPRNGSCTSRIFTVTEEWAYLASI